MKPISFSVVHCKSLRRESAGTADRGGGPGGKERAAAVRRVGRAAAAQSRPGGPGRTGQAIDPPSTRMAVPVMLPAAGPARNATVPAISSAVL